MASYDCMIKNCFKVADAEGGARGLCSKHYARLQRGQSFAERSQYEKTPLERFWEKVDKQQDHWLWTGSKDAKGYGHFRVARDGSSQIYKAHRFAWEQLVGPIPEGMTIDHVQARCTITSCIRPDHMEVVTRSENSIRKNARYEHAGQSMTIRQWAEHVGVPYASLASRINRGMTMTEALTKPFRRSPRTAA